jgi:hypothetical protein
MYYSSEFADFTLCICRPSFLLPFCTSVTFVLFIQHFLCFTSESGSFLVPVSPACKISEDFMALWLEMAKNNVVWRHLKRRGQFCRYHYREDSNE